jgi:GNAT superfamily N-acetyltransferase
MSCHHIISDSDIENIYGITKISSFDIETTCYGIERKSAKIDIYSDTAKMNLTDITREYHDDYELRGTEILELGKVALHQTFFLKEEYQRNGIADSLFLKEIRIYREKGFKEIHLDAVEDGVIAWRSLGYSYLDESTEVNLMLRWYEYFYTTFQDIALSERKFIVKKTKNFKQVLQKYRVPNDRITFPEWLRNQGLVTSEPMFYRLDN